MTSFWTPEKIETAQRLWAEGKSLTEIAIAIGHPSRSAVMGKLYRLGAPKRDGGGPRPRRAKRPAPPRQQQVQGRVTYGSRQWMPAAQPADPFDVSSVDTEAPPRVDGSTVRPLRPFELDAQHFLKAMGWKRSGRGRWRRREPSPVFGATGWLSA